MQHNTDKEKASVTPEVYASQDVPGNFGFIGCDSDQYETREAAEKAAKATVRQKAPDKTQMDAMIQRSKDYGLKVAVPNMKTDTQTDKVKQWTVRMGDNGPDTPWFGAYDSSGKLRATLESESEAYFYIRNRAHMNGGSYKPIVNQADKLAEALRGICKISHSHEVQYWLDDARTPKERLEAILQLSRQALAEYEASKR